MRILTPNFGVFFLKNADFDAKFKTWPCKICFLKKSSKCGRKSVFCWNSAKFGRKSVFFKFQQKLFGVKPRIFKKIIKMWPQNPFFFKKGINRYPFHSDSEKSSKWKRASTSVDARFYKNTDLEAKFWWFLKKYSKVKKFQHDFLWIQSFRHFQKIVDCGNWKNRIPVCSFFMQFWVAKTFRSASEVHDEPPSYTGAIFL